MTTSPVPLIVRRVIPGSRMQIFSAFTRSEALAQWFTPSPEIDIEVLAFEFVAGGQFRFRYTMGDGRQPVVGGTYTVIAPPSKIVMSWIWEAPDALADIPMQVTFEFLKRQEATEVVVTHWGIPSDQACTIHEHGWERTLAGLEHFIVPAHAATEPQWLPEP